MRTDNRRPAVCIVRHNYYYFPDGHVRRDAEALAQAGYDVHVVALRRPDESGRQTINGVTVHRLPVRRRRGSALRYLWEYGAFLALAFVAVALLHARHRFRVVEVDNMPDVLVFSALIPKLTGARVIFYIFDNMPELLMVTRGLGARHPVVRLLGLIERASAAFADQVVVTQELARRAVRGRGVPARKVAVVLNGPDEGVFKRRAPAPRAGGERGFEIVTHGTILRRCGIQVLIDALPRLAAEIPGLRLRVIGGGDRQELEERARRNGVADRVRFDDWIRLEDLPDELLQADLGYVGMLCDLMLSNKLMEYAALQIPAIVARWPTYEQYYPDDAVTYFRAGSVDDVMAAVLAVYRAPEAARARAERAAALYQRYRWTVQREVYLGIYADLLARPKGRRADAPAQSSD
ncbi:MAG TPA: glycosyltransferase [Thermomicrobiales bacterium]|nr:glycosyltransferase [Thermomicrobiales bacterium]